MASGIGLSPEFLARNKGVLDSVASGPSVAEVNASRPVGLGLSGASSAPGAEPSALRKGLGIAGRVIGGIASLGMSEGQRALVMEQQRQRAIIEEQIKAETRQRSLQNAILAIDRAQTLARNVASVSDPDQRAAVLEQTKAALVADSPELVGLFDSMVANEHLAFVERTEAMSRALRGSRTFGNYMAINGHADKMPDAVLTQSMAEWGRSEAREFLPTARGMTSRLLKFAQQEDPARFAAMKESDQTLTTTEAEALVAEYADKDPDFNDPAKRSAYLATLREFGDQLGFAPAERVEVLGLFEEKERIKAKYDKEGTAQKNAVNVVTPVPIAGKTTFLSYDGGRTIVTDRGTIPAPPGSFIGVATGKPEELGFGKPSAPQLADLRKAEVQTRNFLALAKSTREVFEGRPEVLGAAGTLAQRAVELQASAEGFTREFGILFSVDGKPATAEEVRASAEKLAGKTLETASRRLGAQGADRARVRSAVVGLAFAAAAAAGQTGRSVSDRDVERFMRRIGESASPEIFATVLQDIEREVAANFENFYSVVARDVPGAPPLPNVRQPLGARDPGMDPNDKRTRKGEGFSGRIPIPAGPRGPAGFATEFSVPINEGLPPEQAAKLPSEPMPTIGPWLSETELDFMANDIIPNGKPIPDAILKKARAHALKRIAEGKSPFFSSSEGIIIEEIP